jgi:hypothetical protein
MDCARHSDGDSIVCSHDRVSEEDIGLDLYDVPQGKLFLFAIFESSGTLNGTYQGP